MTTIADVPLEPLDTHAMGHELDELQQRLDLLAGRGANPYAIARLQRALHAARRDLALLAADEREPHVEA